MSRANLWRASLLMVALTAIACGQENLAEPQQEGTLATREDEISQNKALILASSVLGGENSAEAAAARLAGMTVVMATNEQWAAMTTQDFGLYRAIILGDAGCASLEAVSAAVANRHVWGPAVNSHVFIVGTAPVANGANIVTQKGIKFAGYRGGYTGMYISLSCYYQNAAPNTHVELLEPFGLVSIQGAGCHNTAHIVGEHTVFTGLTDEVMSNWQCSVNAQFNTFPQANFAPWSIAKFPQGASVGGTGREFVDGTFGAPYILARGTKLKGCGNAEQEVGEACDYGEESNGVFGSDCSATCQLNWCGNGVVDEGETCDEGWDNGFGACPKSCRLLPAPPPPTRRPPLALCKHVTVSAGPFCGGVSALIDDGSSDPDGDLVGCVQDTTSFGVGTTAATLTCTDQHGLASSCTGTVQVTDDLAPTITCPAASTFECGVGTAELTPAEAQDNCGAPYVSHSMDGEGFSLGAARGVIWSASDGENEVSCSTSVTMVDTKAPSLALAGAAVQQLECGMGQYAEAGATASDACTGDLSSHIAISGTVNAAARGAYKVAYSVKDASSNAASAERTVNVVDTKAPSIALVGSPTMRLECGVDGFINPGATAVDACSGNLTGAILKSGTVNTAAVGSYEVSYNVTDGAGLSASAVRTVQVADAKAPVLALRGDSSMALECGVGQYTEAGATASDACTGDLSNRVSISGTVNAAARGAYTVAYSVTDASSNTATAARTVSVNDTLAPSIALAGSPTMRLECGVDSFINPGATAVDACSGNLTGAILKSGTVNTAAVGSYPVSYSVTDGVGLSASAVRTVQVADARAPVLALKGTNPQVVECGMGQYVEAGATASDVCTGDLSNRIAIIGGVNAAAKGTYSVAYSVKDASDNAAFVERTVNVVDTKAPSITLLGAASMSVTRGSTFTDPGATALDACSGNLTGAILKSGSVNTSVAGTYTLQYTVQDGQGLSASATRTVTVEEPQSCTSVAVKPTREIWPPNHKMWSFKLSECAAVANPCGAPVDINAVGTITSIYSDEVEDAAGNGDGSTTGDIVITGKSSFQLRAERQGKGNGRVYGVNFKVTDSSGAVTTATCKFSVPHDQRPGGEAIDSGAAAGYTVNAPSWMAGL